ncbi:MAG: methylmalonyl Co-A mutase-associated GTPase MeaB [Flavobacteriaceae bacterium]|nr:methylmalonyl Co-A mutase-associated GTPase MeaB [Flavobacteriaceae bacterium]
MSIKKNKSALSEVEGIKQPSIINPLLKNKKWVSSKNSSVIKIVKEIKKTNIAFLSKAITLIESTNVKHQKKATKIINACLPYANKSIRIGITGVPGVGKSTFIEVFGKLLTNNGNKVAVLAIDPSSSINKGSILGDKTRMEKLVTDQNAFIRPSPSGESLGGVARKTRETIILCEAAGFNIILIETVGVGQSETAVHKMVDFFLLLKLAGAGDELQGIKRGIIEMADAIVINKADNENEKATKLAKSEFTRALHLYPLKDNNWQPKVMTCSAFYNKGINAVWKIIEQYIKHTKSNHFFNKKRNEQNQFWLLETINERLKTEFYSNTKIKIILKKEINKVNTQKISPFNVAEKLLSIYFNQ